MIYDEGEAGKILKEAIKDEGESIDYLDMYASIITSAKQDYQNVRETILMTPGVGPIAVRIYDRYRQRLEASNAVDFDDLLYFTVDIFSRNEYVRRKWQSKFGYLLIDEYQDTNGIQLTLTELLAQTMPVVAVGDFMQSIYGFRGGRVENIKKYISIFSPDIIKLEKNYRSKRGILKLANMIVDRSANNWEDLLLKLWTDHSEYGKVEFQQFPSNDIEVSDVADKVIRFHNDGYSYDDFAILVRSRYLMRGFEETFLRCGIPCELVGATGFYQRAEIRDMVSYLRFLLNPADRAAFERIINRPKRGFGDKAVAAIKAAYKSGSWVDALNTTKLGAKAFAEVQRFIGLVQKHEPNVDGKPFETLMALLEELKYQEFLEKVCKDDWDDRWNNVSELANMLYTAQTAG